MVRRLTWSVPMVVIAPAFERPSCDGVALKLDFHNANREAQELDRHLTIYWAHFDDRRRGELRAPMEATDRNRARQTTPRAPADVVPIRAAE